MERARPLLIGLFVTALTGFFIWAIFSPKSDINEIVSEKLAAEKEKTDIAFHIVTFSEMSDGIKYWELNATSSTINNSTGLTNLRSVDGFFFKEGKSTLKFIAPKAVWYMNSKQIHLYEPFGYDVRYEKDLKEEIKRVGSLSKLISYFNLSTDKPLTRSRGYWFKAKSLIWKLSTKKLYCDGGIMLTKGDATIRSNSLEADVALEKVMLTGRPIAVILMERDGTKLTIAADSFMVDSGSDLIYADNNVSIKSRSATITTSNAVYDQKNDILTLTGSVTLMTKNISAWGESAEYSLSDHIATLAGNARAIRDKSELRGEKISVLTDEGMMFVTGRSKATINESEIDKLK